MAWRFCAAIHRFLFFSCHPLSNSSSVLGPRIDFYADKSVIRFAVDNLRRQFSKHGRTNSAMSSHGNHQNGQPSGSGTSDERTPLIDTATRLGNTARDRSEGDGRKPLYQDDRAWVRIPMQFFHLTWLTLTSNYVNVLLVFVPAGIVLGALNVNPTAIFIVNFLAIMPLAALLSFATEELSAKLGQTIGGLMNATFGNAVELIVSRFGGIAKSTEQAC